MSIPIYRELVTRNIPVHLAVDGSKGAPAGIAFRREGIEFEHLNSESILRKRVSSSTLVMAGSAGTTYHIETTSIECGQSLGKPTIIASDSWLNHLFPHWRYRTPTFWFAIDEPHQRDILRYRPQWAKDRVPIVGQPAFDELSTIANKKSKLRESLRNTLGIPQTSFVVLYWGLGGDSKQCSQGFDSILYALPQLAKRFTRLVLLTSIHPNLEYTLGPEYIEDRYRELTSICQTHEIQLIWRNTTQDNISSQCLNLVSDVVLNHYSTAGIESAILGIPTVNILLPIHQAYFKRFGQDFPYQSILKSGAAFPAFSKHEIFPKIIHAIHPKARELSERAGRSFLPNASSKTIGNFVEKLYKQRVK